MANLNFGITDPNMDLTVNMTVADNDLPRIMTYLMSTSYGTVELEDGTTRDATEEEAAQAFASGILQGLLDQTVRHERQEAAKAAAEAITDISATPS